MPQSYLQKASVGPSYNCCLRAYAIALLFFYDLASEKPRFTCEVEARDIRGIDVWESTRGTSQGILLEQTDHCGAARTREKGTSGTCVAYARLVLTKSVLQLSKPSMKSPVWLRVRLPAVIQCVLRTGSLDCNRSLPVAMAISTEYSSPT